MAYDYSNMEMTGPIQATRITDPTGRARLVDVARWLEAGAPERDGIDGFSMQYYRGRKPGCGTVCCIAGALCAFNGLKLRNPVRDSAKRAAGLLGLPHTDAIHHLFMPITWDGGPDGGTWDTIKPKHAARVVRRFLRTGEIDWNL